MTKRIKPWEGNQSFCMAPWTHTYLSPQSERRLCCASTEPAQNFKQYIDTDSGSNIYKPLSLDNWWNSEHLKSVRKRMMAGEILPECQVCNKKLLHTTVYKDHFNTLFKEIINEAYDKTQDDGSTDMKCISFDYRFSNLCNFMCRMCGSNLSSSWETEERKHLNKFEEERIWATKDNKKQMDEFVINVAEPEFQQAIDERRIREIYWVGGEPLMYPQHWKFMKMIVDNGLSQQVYARYNTNLSRIVFNNINLFDNILNDFSAWEVCASIDGTNQIGEYIRTGLSYDKFIENFEHGLKFANGRSKRLNLDFTITTPGLFEIENMFNLSLKYDVPIITKTTFAFSSNIFMSPLVLPKHILSRLINDVLGKIKPKATRKQQGMIDILEGYNNRNTFEEEYDDWQLGRRKGKSFMLELEARRKSATTMEEIMKKDKELYKWWKSIEI